MAGQLGRLGNIDSLTSRWYELAVLETAIQKAVHHPVEKAYDLLGPTMARVESRLEQTFLSSVELIPEVSNHLIGAGGKRIRPVLLLLTARVLDVDAERVADLGVASELFHNASLLHDDVVDRSELRRGVPAAPKVFGNAASVLVGDFLLAQGLSLVVHHGDLDLVQELSRTLSAMAEGEVLQLIRSGQLQLSHDEYVSIINGKTAGLFAWCARAGACPKDGARGKQAEQAALFGRAFGMAFQVADDVSDYITPSEDSGKDLANDLLQGKATLPLLLACETDPSLREKVSAASHEATDTAGALWILNRVRDSQAVPRALSQARDYASQAKDALKHLPAGPHRDCLADLSDYVVDRIDG